MSARVQSVVNASFQGLFTFQDVVPLSDKWDCSLPFNFANVANMEKFDGTYTPNNDTFNIVHGLVAKGFSPNFFIFICDGVAVFGDSAFRYLHVPINRFVFSTIPPFGQNLVDGFSLDGQTGFNNPMVQNVPINYTLLFGQAAIT